MKKFVLLAVFALFLGMPALYAEKIVIKMASIAPENSPWGNAISKLAEDWGKISDGQIEIKVYHNGIAGGESDVIRKMRFNQIQAAFSPVSASPRSSPRSFPSAFPR